MAGKVKSGPKRGRQGGATPAFEADPEIVPALEAAIIEGASDASACEIAGISHNTLCEWMKRGAAGDRRYVGVSKRLTRARELRKPAAIARLGGAGMNEWVEDENGTRTLVPGDWRATDAYLKHHADGTKGNIVLRKLRAEAEEAELRVAAIREARKSGGAAGVVLWQALDALPEPMRSAVRAQLEASGYQMLAPRDLGGEPSDEDVARFCMSRETEGE